MVNLQSSGLIPSRKETYRKFCRDENDLPIFSKDWWLDAVCGEENWNIAYVENDREIIASLPYYIQKKQASKIISMPVLTQTLGPYIKYPANQNSAKKLSYEKEIMNELIDQLPDFDLFIQHFHHTITNWLPFYWRDFKQSTRYTYIIDDLSDLERLYSNFSHAKRKNIKKAEKKLTVRFDLPANDFYNHHKTCLRKENKRILYNFSLFNRIYSACYKYNAGKTIYAIDDNGIIHSALFVIWTENSAYNLISSIDPDLKDSGSNSLLIREIIGFVSRKTKMFDFEGSMVEGIERSFRQFGARQVPYFLIYYDKRKFYQKTLSYIANRLKF